MKTILLMTFLLALNTTVSAAQTNGNCEHTAIEKALKTAPGIDESSPASLIEIKLIETQKKDSKTSVEKYYVQTEDQGGTAASVIAVEFKNVSRPSDEVFRFKCKVLSQKWVE